MTTAAFILSCEHAVNTVPEQYRSLFIGNEHLLNTHRGIDFGALDIAKGLQKELSCPLVTAETTRLLIDCNRSLSRNGCFSEISKPLPSSKKQQLAAQYYHPYRNAVLTTIKDLITAGKPVLHLSIHSFTPVLNDVTRNADIGLLYDPARLPEKQLAQKWLKQLKQHTSYRVRLNYPYRGNSDGFTTALRRLFPENNYSGFEIEINQALVNSPLNIACLVDILSQLVLQTQKTSPFFACNVF
ncbi:N-formylglutamate amidohydrolase [Legionella dresdenensis]|uniref:N-formylglutamate amidohydrolase n=1 Tax=Legionella dresdenensis TaxID=450200 RepID=A0ABV8CFB2_9GAMM